MAGTIFNDDSHDEFTVRKVGKPFTKDYRVYFERDGVPVSPFHDISLYPDKHDKNVLHMVVEVPRWTNAKFEISRDKCLNPIYQDILNGEVRFNKNVFPYKGYMWNYGAFPQTWEDPDHKHPDTGHEGDNDPLDACEIGRAVATTGEVKKVKVLGILGLLDNQETDWKVIVIDVNDPLAEKLDDIGDVERYLPGLLDATRDWFRIYKMPDGEPPNEYALEGKFQDKKYAMRIIQDCADNWKRLVRGKVKHTAITIENTTLTGTPGYIDPEEVSLPPNEDLPPAPVNRDLEEWFFVDREALRMPGSPSVQMSNLHIDLRIA